jgi:hypothetical protein
LHNRTASDQQQERYQEQETTRHIQTDLCPAFLYMAA